MQFELHETRRGSRLWASREMQRDKVINEVSNADLQEPEVEQVTARSKTACGRKEARS